MLVVVATATLTGTMGRGVNGPEPGISKGAGEEAEMMAPGVSGRDGVNKAMPPTPPGVIANRPGVVEGAMLHCGAIVVAPVAVDDLNTHTHTE